MIPAVIGIIGIFRPPWRPRPRGPNSQSFFIHSNVRGLKCFGFRKQFFFLVRKNNKEPFQNRLV